MDKTGSRTALIDAEYTAYLREEWARFRADTQRQNASVAATAGARIDRVLDVGCGAGQELIPFAVRGALGIGTDVAPAVGIASADFFREDVAGARVAFARSAAEALPFRSGAFDVVISRLSIPYTDNRRAISEMSRVLRPGGILLLKIHHGFYYVNKFWRGLVEANFLSSVHAARVLASGVLYHLLGRQIRNRLVTNETFQTKWLLRRELARQGLTIAEELPDSNRLTPSFAIRKIN